MQNTAHLIALIHEQMFNYERGNPERIAHLTKVHDYARTIGLLEGLDEETLATLETAALVHDIGIKESLEKYGKQQRRFAGEGRTSSCKSPPDKALISPLQ